MPNLADVPFGVKHYIGCLSNGLILRIIKDTLDRIQGYDAIAIVLNYSQLDTLFIKHIERSAAGPNGRPHSI